MFPIYDSLINACSLKQPLQCLCSMVLMCNLQRQAGISISASTVSVEKKQSCGGRVRSMENKARSRTDGQNGQKGHLRLQARYISIPEFEARFGNCGEQWVFTGNDREDLMVGNAKTKQMMEIYSASAWRGQRHLRSTPFWSVWDLSCFLHSSTSIPGLQGSGLISRKHKTLWVSLY